MPITKKPEDNILQKYWGIIKSKSVTAYKWLIKHRTYAFWLLPFAMVLFSYLLIFKDLPSPASLGKYEIPLTTKIYDRNGKLLYDIFVSQNRTPVPLSQIPKHVQQATIAIEDKNFYQHGAINLVGGMLRAAIASVTKGQVQGGSTITQQLVKNALLTPERSVTRKIKEIILSFWVELLYPKDKILELYLNQVPYGGTAWGIETASETYFGKTVQELTLGEATLLAGLPQAPSTYSPFGSHPELAFQRQIEVLKRMQEDGYITAEQEKEAENEKLIFKYQTGINAPHFVMYVKEQLVNKYGESLVEKGGLKVTTTLDLDLQDYAQATLAAEVEKLKKLFCQQRRGHNHKSVYRGNPVHGRLNRLFCFSERQFQRHYCSPSTGKFH